MAKAAEVPKTENQDEIEIVNDDEPVVASPEVVKDDTSKVKEPDDVDAAVAELKGQVEKERLARIAAENVASDATARADKAHGDLKTFRSKAQEDQFNLVVSQLDAVTREADGLEQQLALAHTNGDSAAVAKIQRAMSRLEARAEQLEQGRDALEARKTAGPDPEEAQSVRQAASVDPVGDYINKLPVSASDKAWLNKHRDAVTDTRKFQALTSTASYAINSKGIAAGTPEFYAFLEAELGYSKPADKADAVVETPRAATPSKTYSAPPSRESSSMSGKKPPGSRIRLSPEQRESAKVSGITDAEYARNLVELGKTDPSIAKTIQYVN